MPTSLRGQKADIRAAKSHVRSTPESDRKSGFPHKVMSPLPLEADICGALDFSPSLASAADAIRCTPRTPIHLNWPSIP